MQRAGKKAAFMYKLFSSGKSPSASAAKGRSKSTGPTGGKVTSLGGSTNPFGAKANKQRKGGRGKGGSKAVTTAGGHWVQERQEWRGTSSTTIDQAFGAPPALPGGNRTGHSRSHSVSRTQQRQAEETLDILQRLDRIS